MAKATPDGSTIGISIGGPLAINTLLFKHLPYDPHKDIAPITQLITQPSALAVNPELKRQFRRRTDRAAEEEPRQIQFRLDRHRLAVATRHGGDRASSPAPKSCTSPYKSSPQAIMAVIRGDAQMACMPAISVLTQAKAGKVKMLAVSTAKRSPYLPDVPTLKESGIDVEADAWMGLIAPGGTPKAMIDKINKAVVSDHQAPAVATKLATQLMVPVGSTPQEFRAKIDAEIGRWSPVIKAANMKVN